MENQPVDKPLVIAGREFRSRLFMGTGMFPDNETMVEAWDAGDDLLSLFSFRCGTRLSGNIVS